MKPSDRTGRSSRQLAALALAALCPALTCAQHLDPSVSGKKMNASERLTTYEDSYAVWGRMRNNGWTRNDEQALRARLSFKYTFCGPQFRRAHKDQSPAQARATDEETSKSWCPTSGKFWPQAELFFGYAAEFDFYAGTRPSGPVIGRVNAPGFFARVPAKALGLDWSEGDGVEVGLQHRSDGQTTEVTNQRDARVADERYAAGDYRYFDTISRGANFLIIAADKALSRPPVGESLALRAKLRVYLGSQDSDVTWGPLANTGRRFSDYDRLQLQAWWRVSEMNQFDLAWRLGDRGLATDSWTFGWQLTIGEVPWYVRVHRGPMNTLSNYTQRQDSIGVGLRFAGF